MGQHVTLSDRRSPPLSICDLQCAHPELPRFITIVVGVSYARANAHHRDAPFGVTLGQATSALEFQFHFERHRLRWGKAYEMLRDISLLLSLFVSGTSRLEKSQRKLRNALDSGVAVGVGEYPLMASMRRLGTVVRLFSPVAIKLCTVV